MRGGNPVLRRLGRCIYAPCAFAVLACTDSAQQTHTLFLPDTDVYRGYYVVGHEVRAFHDCAGAEPLWLVDSTDGVLDDAFAELAGGALPYDSIFIGVRGRLTRMVSDGFAAEYPGTLITTDLRQAEGEGVGCDDVSQGVFKAFGNEPFWDAELSPDTLRLIRLGEQPLTFAVNGGPADGGWVFVGNSVGTGPERIRVEINERLCVDGMSGSLFSYAVRVDLDDEAVVGCGRRPL